MGTRHRSRQTAAALPGQHRYAGQEYTVPCLEHGPVWRPTTKAMSNAAGSSWRCSKGGQQLRPRVNSARGRSVDPVSFRRRSAAPNDRAGLWRRLAHVTSNFRTRLPPQIEPHFGDESHNFL
jgi:hypothetical protein